MGMKGGKKGGQSWKGRGWQKGKAKPEARVAQPPSEWQWTQMAEETEQATESDWSEEEKRAWYRKRPDDAEYYRVQRDLLRNGLTRKAKLTQLPPVREDDPLLWAIGLDGASPLERPEAVQEQPLHVSLAYDDELTEDVKRQLQEEWGEEREVTLQFHRFGNGASGELSLKWDPVANSQSVQKAHKMGYYGQDKRGDWARPLHVSF